MELHIVDDFDALRRALARIATVTPAQARRAARRLEKVLKRAEREAANAR